MATSPVLSLAAPETAADLDAIRALFLEYADSLGFSLAYQSFERELAELPGDYAPPTGALLLAKAEGIPAGCVALRQHAPAICEMKRLYVPPAFRALRTTDGRSLGRALTFAILERARGLGYQRLRLDTIAGKMSAAIHLYRTLGFVEIPPYYPSPMPDTLYFELVL